MELPYSFLYNQQTKVAFDKLMGTDFDGKLAYNIKKMYDAFDKNFKQLQSQYSEALKVYSELDEKGNIIEPSGPGSFKIKDGQLEAWQKKVTEMMDLTFTIEKVTKVPMYAIVENPNLKLSSKDLAALEPIIDGLDFEI